MADMSARDRFLSAIRREGPDRVPISLWWHAYNLNAGIGFREFARDGKKNAMAHLAFLREFSVDFLKVTPDGLFFLEDWGGRLEYDEGMAMPRAAEYAIKSAEDWERLDALDPRRAKLHSEQLRALEIISEKLGDFPFLETVFNPFTTAIKIAGEERVRRDMKGDPRALKKGLETITETTIDFIREALDIGATGIFYSIKTLSAKSITRAEFEEFNRPYDLKIMDSMRDADVIMPTPNIMTNQTISTTRVIGIMASQPPRGTSYVSPRCRPRPLGSILSGSRSDCRSRRSPGS